MHPHVVTGEANDVKKSANPLAIYQYKLQTANPLAIYYSTTNCKLQCSFRFLTDGYQK